MGDALRVTVVATGLGARASKKQSTPFTVVRTVPTCAADGQRE